MKVTKEEGVKGVFPENKRDSQGQNLGGQRKDTWWGMKKKSS